MIEKIKPYNGGQWTTARFNSFIKGALRNASLRWGPKNEAKKAARIERGVYLCAGYRRSSHKTTASLPAPPGKKRRINNAQVNHKVPVVYPAGFDNWDGVVARLFCEVEGFEILCYDCHKKHTNDLRLSKEEWKIVDGFEHYEVSSHGRIRHIENGLRKLVRDKYLRIRMWDINNKKYVLHSVHRLVASAFIPNPNNYLEVNHKDGYKYNAFVSNLEWCNRKQNAIHSATILKNNIGKKNGNFKGYWVTPIGRFETVRLAAEAVNIGYWKVYKWCKNKENGYDFEPIRPKMKGQNDEYK